MCGRPVRPSFPLLVTEHASQCLSSVQGAEISREAQAQSCVYLLYTVAA